MEHEKNISTTECVDLRVTGWADKIQASVNTHVALLLALGLLLLTHVDFVLIVDKVDDGRPRVAVVHIVTKSGCVDDRELDLE